MTSHCIYISPCPAEHGYTLPLQTVKIQISWLLQKPSDLDLHSLSLNILNLYEHLGSSNLIGRKLEVGVAF